MTADVINKISISAEAVFDYSEALALGVLNKRALKAEAEEYLDRMNRAGRLQHERYVRCQYFDIHAWRMLTLFLYRAERVSILQSWELKGLCFAEDWTEDAEDSGQIRYWLKARITELPDADDWAVKYRVNKIMRETEKTLYENVLEEVRDAFDNERDKETAEKLAFLQGIYFEFRGRKRIKEETRRHRAGGKRLR